MEFSKQNVSNYYLYDTQVENLFLSEYMALAPGEYVKAYLLALLHAQMNLPMDDEALAKALSLPVETVLEAWDYWEERGVVRRSYPDPENRERFEVYFVNLKEEAFGRRSPAQKSGSAVQLDDRDLSRLYRDVQTATGRMLEAREPEEIAAWLTEYRMSPEFILYGYKFCAAKRKSTRSRYVGEVLKDWKSKNLSTPAEVEEYLSEMDRHYDLYRRIFRELGFSRSATEEEKRLMNKWFDDYGFDLSRIFEACKKTAGITNPNIHYVDAILSAWYKEERGGKAADPGAQQGGVEALYEKDRRENAEKTERIRREVFTRIPRIKDIMEELRACSIDVSRSMLLGENGKARANQLRGRIEELRAERARLLTAGGYSPQALDTIYTCGKCKDTGVLEDGTRCSCYQEKMRLLAQQEGRA